MMTKTDYSNIDYVVGIDFGSILSGTSHAFTREFDPRCCHITQWPKQKGFIEDQKVPTACLYDKKKKTFTKWGRDALDYYKSKRQEQGDMILVENFNEKLRASLESNSDDHFYKDATVYFFHQMLEYSRKTIDGYIVRDIKDPVLFYVLSVPYNWSKVASVALKKLFTESILDADDHFEIIQQSQAAISFFFQRMYCRSVKTSGKVSLLCDFGGTTCDATVFETATLGDKRIEYLISIGSSHIDIKMKEYISKLLFNNEADAIAKSYPLIRYLMDYFIYSVKPIFGEVGEEDVMIPMVHGGVIEPSTMAQLTENGTISRGQLCIPYKDMRTYVFDSVVNNIIASIGDIIAENNVDSVIVTGGFSESFYLQLKLEECLNENIIFELIKMSGENNATMDGAVYYGLKQIEDARKKL